MSRNIKEIGKELMGKSLNSFHRKTGLTQLEKNNEMQDGILDGILSQVDDAYIKKTEQSNVIHLDGSGDGVVVLDSIEGNTMVNLWDIRKTNPTGQTIKKENTIAITTSENRYSNFFINDKTIFKPNTEYTFIVNIKKNTLDGWIYITSYASSTDKDIFNTNFSINGRQTGIIKRKLTTISDFEGVKYATRSFFDNSSLTPNSEVELDIIILEGDWTNREIPPYFTGLQSSFEDKRNDEGKYEIEILMKNKNLFDGNYVNAYLQGGDETVYRDGVLNNAPLTRCAVVKVPRNTDICMSKETSSRSVIGLFTNYPKNGDRYTLTNGGNIQTINTGNYNYMVVYVSNEGENPKMQIEIGSNNTTRIEPKQNKIKLLLDEPLRAINNIRDRLCIKNGKLVVERNCKEMIYDGKENGWKLSPLGTCEINQAFQIQNVVGLPNSQSSSYSINNRFIDLVPTDGSKLHDKEYLLVDGKYGVCVIKIAKNKLTEESVNGLKTWLQSNPVKVIHNLDIPIYEEVLNEYGEPILLEGYENGTIYIDSTIVPTTTVRYTPKMESFKTLKEVNNNNIMLTNDVNDNIIPYMMDVDLMIMEKEMALMSHKNIRTIGVKDMTSMQKRTQDMLTRLIKGKTLTEQECKTRVVTYLDAGKITDAQADELMLLISEVYA